GSRPLAGVPSRTTSGREEARQAARRKQAWGFEVRRRNRLDPIQRRGCSHESDVRDTTSRKGALRGHVKPHAVRNEARRQSPTNGRRDAEAHRFRHGCQDRAARSQIGRAQTIRLRPKRSVWNTRVVEKTSSVEERETGGSRSPNYALQQTAAA